MTGYVYWHQMRVHTFGQLVKTLVEDGLQKGEQFVIGVRSVSDDAFCPAETSVLIDVLPAVQLGTGDLLYSFHYFCIVFTGSLW